MVLVLLLLLFCLEWGGVLVPGLDSFPVNVMMIYDLWTIERLTADIINEEERMVLIVFVIIIIFTEGEETEGFLLIENRRRFPDPRVRHDTTVTWIHPVHHLFLLFRNSSVSKSISFPSFDQPPGWSRAP